MGSEGANMSNMRTFWAWLLLAMLVTLCAGSGAIAQDLAWRVNKSSGEVWITTSGAQPVALTSDAILGPGDTIRTGQNGRILLMRGAETMLISANSVVGLPRVKGEGMSTTIFQQAGSVLFDVEKRNVQHFEVSTPYLAAVVKGTQFRVTVTNDDSRVEVLNDQVQVTDYKTGQYALVNRDQVAMVSLREPLGLSLSGVGTLSPIQQGTPHNSSVSPVTMPIEDLSAPGGTENGQQGQPLARHAEGTPASSDGTSKEGWASGLVRWGKDVLNFNGRKNRDEGITRVLALPAIIGLSVAVGAGVLRRRQRHKQKPGRRR
jgi:hypothetical protein